MKTPKASSSRLVTVLAIVGIVGPILFWTLLLLAQSLHPSYDAWKESISRLELGPFGWLQTMNFYLITIFIVAFGVAVYLGIAKSRISRIASLLLVVMGLAHLLSAVFQVDVDPSGPKSIAYITHNMAFIISMALFPFAAFMLVPNLWSDVRWRPFAFLTIVAGTMVLMLELAWLVSQPIGSHLIDTWFGTYERILFSIQLAWMVMISTRLLHIGHRL